MPDGIDISTVRLGDARLFVQSDGIAPNNPYLYFGCTTLQEADQDQGSPDPVYCPSPTQRNAWIIVDEIPKQQGLGKVDFSHRMDRFLRDAWWDIRVKKCNFHAQVILGRCTKPDDPESWDSKVVYKNMRLTDFKLPLSNPMTGDDNDAGVLTGSLSFRDFYPVRKMVFNERADALIVAEIVDGVYRDSPSCGDCGVISDGCQNQFWLTKANAGSPGLSSQVLYSQDKLNFTANDVTTLAGASGVVIAAVGRYIVVFQNTATNQHHYAVAQDILDGVATWSKVTGGYIALKGALQVYVKNSAKTFISGKGGYIYLMTDPTRSVIVLSDGTLTTQDLNGIHGYGNTVVAVGGSNAVLVSSNNGSTFTSITGPAVGVILNRVWCVSENIWFVGTATGLLYFTANGGKTWTNVGLDTDITSINDIAFYDDVIGYIAVTAGLNGRVYRTTNGGYTWSNKDPGITGLPANARINAVCACGPNEVGAGGAKISGDGILAIAS